MECRGVRLGGKTCCYNRDCWDKYNTTKNAREKPRRTLFLLRPAQTRLAHPRSVHSCPVLYIYIYILCCATLIPIWRPLTISKHRQCFDIGSLRQVTLVCLYIHIFVIGLKYKSPVTPYRTGEMDGHWQNDQGNPLMSIFYIFKIWRLRSMSVNVR